jgi:FlaA1/EpsC-like NDP-sugar epimerase
MNAKPHPNLANRDPLARLRQQKWWPSLRLLGLLVTYGNVLAGSWWLAYQLRFDFNVPALVQMGLAKDWHTVLAVQLIFLASCGQFSGVTRYFSLPDLYRLALALMGSAVVIWLIRSLDFGLFAPPRGVLLVNAMLALGALGAFRLAYRRLYEGRWNGLGRVPGKAQVVAIMGAGDVGSSLVLELNRRSGLGLKPVLFLDDDPQKWKSYLHGIPVVGGPGSLARWVAKYKVSTLVMAMPSAPAKRIAEVTALARECGLTCVTVPSVEQLTLGKVAVSQLRAVSIEDLLGREPVHLEMETIRETFTGRVVMVTGAGGSIGSELCRQIAGCQPRQLLLVEQSEVQLFQIEQEMIGRGHGDIIVPLVANVADLRRMGSIFDVHAPSVIFHAAAHKHVPMMEFQPGEAVRNNALATARLAEMALDYRVERFLMISTDKAVNPTSAMGASKRLAEVYLQALAAQNPTATKFVCVRFGNVLGSSGSVVPTFTKQIAAGGPVTVTHPEMVRYFMTIPEAVGLVLQSCTQGEGGEIFVLDMGKPVKIASLARQMIELSGFRPDEDIEIKFVGLRPGEKLFEELHCHGENFHPTRHPRIMRFITEPRPFADVRSAFVRMESTLYAMSAEVVKQRIVELVPEYTPDFGQAFRPWTPVRSRISGTAGAVEFPSHDGTLDSRQPLVLVAQRA